MSKLFSTLVLLGLVGAVQLAPQPNAIEANAEPANMVQANTDQTGSQPGALGNIFGNLFRGQTQQPQTNQQQSQTTPQAAPVQQQAQPEQQQAQQQQQQQPFGQSPLFGSFMNGNNNRAPQGAPMMSNQQGSLTDLLTSIPRRGMEIINGLMTGVRNMLPGARGQSQNGQVLYNGVPMDMNGGQQQQGGLLNMPNPFANSNWQSSASGNPAQSLGQNGGPLGSLGSTLRGLTQPLTNTLSQAGLPQLGQLGQQVRL